MYTIAQLVEKRETYLCLYDVYCIVYYNNSQVVYAMAFHRRERNLYTIISRKVFFKLFFECVFACLVMVFIFAKQLQERMST